MEHSSSGHSFPAHAADALNAQSLSRIASAIESAEKETSAVIRVSIHDERDHSEAGKDIAAVAKSEFAKLHMDELEARNGILLLVLYAERKYYLYADAGVHAKVDPDSWTDVAETLGQHFRKGHFEEGITEAVKRIAHHMKHSMPRSGAASGDAAAGVTLH